MDHLPGSHRLRNRTNEIQERARELRAGSTEAEGRLWDAIRQRKLEGLRFRRQHTVGTFIFDFFCAERKLVVEVDGPVHRTDEAVERDAYRDSVTRAYGYKVIRIRNEEINDDLPRALRRIADAANMSHEPATDSPPPPDTAWVPRGGGPYSPVLDRPAFAALAERLRGEGKRIVFTNGVFDLLHVGHVRYLQEARALGDALFVGVNSDASVRRLKGPTRPVNTEEERAEVLAALSCVDAVCVFPEDTPHALIEAVRPAVHAKGGDYASPDALPETPLVRSLGGEVVILKLVPGRSTTRIIKMLEGGR